MPLLVSTQSFDLDVMTEYGLLFEMCPDSGDLLRSRRIETPARVTGEERVKPGLRGVSSFGGEVYVASWGAVHVLDPVSFDTKCVISHEWMSDLHGIFVNEDGLWVTSSLPDAMILYDFDGNPVASFWAPETFLYSERSTVDKGMDWRERGKGFRGFSDFHANHVEVRGDSVYVTGRSANDGRVIRFSCHDFIRNGGVAEVDIELFVKHLHGPHDGFWADDGFYVTETMGSTVARIDGSGKVVSRIHVRADDSETDPRDIGLLARLRHRIANVLKGRPTLSKTCYWTRGLAITPEYLFVGQSTWAGESSSRARVSKVNRRSGEVVDTFYIEPENYPEARIFQIVDTS